MTTRTHWTLGLSVLTIAAALPLGTARAQEGRERLLEVRAQMVDAKPGGRVQLKVWGRGEAGHDLTRWHELGPEFRVEETPFEEELEDAATGYRELHHRILLDSRGGPRIAGWIRYWGKPGSAAGYVSCLGGELTNACWGFDTRQQRIWVSAHAEEMPPVPAAFRESTWRGLAFAVPVELERVARSKLLEALQARSATLAGAGERADVVILPDDIDFVRTRNTNAEALVGRGARVLWERELEKLLAAGA